MINRKTFTFQNEIDTTSANAEASFVYNLNKHSKLFVEYGVPSGGFEKFKFASIKKGFTTWTLPVDQTNVGVKPDFLWFDKNIKAGLSVPEEDLAEIVKSFEGCSVDSGGSFFTCACDKNDNDESINSKYPSLMIKVGDDQATTDITFKASALMRYSDSDRKCSSRSMLAVSVPYLNDWSEERGKTLWLVGDRMYSAMEVTHDMEQGLMGFSSYTGNIQFE
jgi:hypothetical protein